MENTKGQNIIMYFMFTALNINVKLMNSMI